MAGIDNLQKLTTEKAREIGSKGGIASGKAKQARKTLKEELLLLLSQGDTQKNVTIALISKALSGDTKAFEVLRDSIGEKPKEQLDANVNADINIVVDIE